MTPEINIHNVGTIEICTKQQGESQWIQIRVFDYSGKPEMDITLFAQDGRAVTMKLGEQE